MGLVKNGWSETTLGEVCHKTLNIRWQDHTNESFKYIDLSSVSRTTLSITKTSLITSDNAPSRAKKIVLKDDVLFATTRPTLKRVTLISDDFNNQICSTGYSVLRANQDLIIPKLIYHFLQSVSFIQRMETLQRGASYPAVSDKDVMNTRLWIPNSLTEQKQIVALLDQAFKAIDQAQQNIEKNIANAKELFQSKLNAIFSQTGEGWEEKNIGELTDLITKGSSPKWQGVNYIDKPGILFITSENVREGNLNTEKKKYLEKKFNDIQKKSILKKGDVLTNIVGASIGRTAIFNLDDISNINQAVCIMRCTPNKLYNYFLMHMLNSPFFKKILHDNEVNNARANLSLTFFKNLVIPLPPIKKQKTIVEEITILNHQITILTKKLESKVTNLEELKKSILQKAFNGELT